MVTLGLAKELRNLGHEVRILAAKRSLPGGSIRPGAWEEYEFEGIPVRRLGRPEEGASRPYRLNYENQEMALGAREFTLGFRPDIVHAMHLQGLSASVLDVFKDLGLPVVYTAADFWTICPVVDLRRHDGVMCEGPDLSHCIRCVASRNPDPRARRIASAPGVVPKLAGLLSRTALDRYSGALRQIGDMRERPEYIREKMESVDHVLAYTELTKKLLEFNGVGVGKMSVSPYGIEASGLAAARKKRRASRTVRVGFVGTLAPHKGPDLPLRAFHEIPELDATLSLYGSAADYGDYAEKLRSLAGGDPRVKFRGTFSRDEVADVFAEIDVLVVPSRWYENAPGTIFESFAAGAPVVATNLGGMSEFVRHEKNGLLFALDDAKSLARQLRRLVEEPGLLEKLRIGIDPVKGIGEYAGEVEAIYKSLVDKRMRAG